MFWARSDQNSGFHGNRQLPLSYDGENVVATLATSFLIGSSSFLHKDNHNISDESEFRPGSTSDCGISCP